MKKNLMMVAAIGVVNAGTVIELVPVRPTTGTPPVGTVAGYDMKGDYTVKDGRFVIKMD